MVWLFPSHMSSELHYHNIPDIKLKTVGTSIVDICAKFKTKELAVVSLILAKLWVLPQSSFYYANFFFFLSLSNTFTRSQPRSCKASCAIPVWAAHAKSHTRERVPARLRGDSALASSPLGIISAVPGRGNLWCAECSFHTFLLLNPGKKSVRVNFPC